MKTTKPFLANSNRALFEQALSQFQNGNLSASKIICERIVKLSPNSAPAVELNGIILLIERRYQDAAAAFSHLTKISTKNANAFLNLGVAQKALGQIDLAIQSYNAAISIDPNDPKSHFNRANCFAELKDFDEAIVGYRTAIELKPNYVEAHANLGNALLEKSSVNEAIIALSTAISLDRSFYDAYYSLGKAFHKIEKYQEAVDNFDSSIKLHSSHFQAHNDRGLALQKLKRLDEALASYDKSIALKPDLAEAYSNRGHTLMELKRFDEALGSYNKAIELKPGLDFLIGQRLHAKMCVCDWRNLTQEIQELRKQIEKSDIVCSPFILLGLVDSLPLQRKCAEIYTNKKFANLQRGLAPTVTSLKHRITIGYFSADFHDHATAYLMAQLFELHNRDRFKVLAFSFGPNSISKTRERMQPNFDAFHEVGQMTDSEIVSLSKQEGVDIAVDLKGFTADSRGEIFASRFAPIQVNYLGYPGTMGADYIDYIIADPTLIPLESQQHYSEKVVYLPHSYQPNDRIREIAQNSVTRVELGLPYDGFVFCCFNNNWKITPDVFDLWMNVLKRTPSSVLWLFENNKHAAENIRQEAQIRGVQPNRLVFAKRMPLAQHLARHKCADLFLDTSPYNAHTSSSDALWSGLPVLTRIGESFASRVAASLLNAIGLPELVTTSAVEYERMAIDLAQNPTKLASIKRKLYRESTDYGLISTQCFMRNILKRHT